MFFIICKNDQLYRQAADDLQSTILKIVLLWGETAVHCKAGNIFCDYSFAEYTETYIFHV